MLSTLDDSKFRFRLKTNSGGTTSLISGTGVVPLNQWVFLTATYDGSQMRIYKDSTLLTSVAKTGSISTDPSVDVSIANQPTSATGGSRPLDGTLDEIRIYSKALSLAQIKEIFKAGYKELCLNNLTLPTLLPELNAYSVVNKLTSNLSISSMKKIDFKAGGSVELAPPFQVDSGAVFSTTIVGCGE
jgi:hypothetical protein